MAGIEYGSHEEQETGASLRKKLEEALSGQKALAKELRKERTSRVLALNPLVSETELADVPLDEVETRAAQLQVAHSEKKDVLLRESLKDRGLDDEAIDAFLAKDPSSEQSSTTAVIDRIRGVSRTAGEPAGRVVNAEGMTPRQKMEFALKENERKKTSAS
jgi:hypothetical protein